MENGGSEAIVDMQPKKKASDVLTVVDHWPWSNTAISSQNLQEDRRWLIYIAVLSPAIPLSRICP